MMDDFLSFSVSMNLDVNGSNSLSLFAGLNSCLAVHVLMPNLVDWGG